MRHGVAPVDFVHTLSSGIIHEASRPFVWPYTTSVTSTHLTTILAGRPNTIRTRYFWTPLTPKSHCYCSIRNRYRSASSAVRGPGFLLALANDIWRIVVRLSLKAPCVTLVVVVRESVCLHADTPYIQASGGRDAASAPPQVFRLWGERKREKTEKSR